MKKIFLAALALVTSTASVQAITVSTPSNGAQLTSPFVLTASTKTCAGLPAVSMGYSIDSGTAVIEPTSFTAKVTASPGQHVLHVKCWGQKVNDQVLLNVLVLAAPVSDITVAAPSYGATVTSPFTLTASTRTCGSKPAVSMGYSIDNGTSVIQPTSFIASVNAPAGAHVLRVKCWGQGVGDQVSLNINVVQPTSPKGPQIPSYAYVQQQIDLLPGWRIKHDPATPGFATGSMTLVSDPTLTGQTEKYYTAFTNAGGILYSNTYGHDTDSTHFVYDVHVWLSADSVLSNLEMDNNQVMRNGHTMIYGFQCSGYAGVWEYTENAGTVEQTKAHWLKSTAPCNPAKWTRNTWHHIQISMSRDDSGNVTYHSVWFDGMEAPINRTVKSEFGLGWALGALVANFQVDGIGTSGSSTIYVDNLKMSRW